MVKSRVKKVVEIRIFLENLLRLLELFKTRRVHLTFRHSGIPKSILQKYAILAVAYMRLLNGQNSKAHGGF